MTPEQNDSIVVDLSTIANHLNTLCVLQEMQLRLNIMEFNRKVSPGNFGAGMLTFEELVAELPAEEND